MGTKRRDRTNTHLGCFHVLEPDPKNPRMWLGRWGCCGREQSVSPERCTGLEKTKPKRCILCVRDIDTGADDFAERMKEARKEKKLAHNRAESPALEGVTVPGWGFVPVLHGPKGR